MWWFGADAQTETDRDTRSILLIPFLSNRIDSSIPHTYRYMPPIPSNTRNPPNPLSLAARRATHEPSC